ncbi:MAG: peptide-methionine (S)-S-oxide reductase MsrA [Ruminococcaceae bacterium]|nr:peptide-methionine (S)-S-oxide reductase MsrA [Oscillospiraceae bacterium]
MQTIYLAGGCFWGAQKYLDAIPGVLHTEVGYANGKTANPTYEQVCREGTDHAEAVKVDYDPQVAPLPFLLEVFYDAIDPTTVNRQGGDVGRQYRTGIYTTSPADLPVIEASLKALAAKLGKPVAVEAAPLDNYYTAEEYHQKYLDKNPGGYCHIGPAQFARAAAARYAPKNGNDKS